MTSEAAAYLLRQFDTAWKLTAFHLNDLSTNECLWRPASRGPHVIQCPDGTWHGEWPEKEAYDLGPPSIAWLTWHIGFWWSTVLDRSFGPGTLSREAVLWPGTGEATVAWIHELSESWRCALGALSSADLKSSKRTQWPFKDRPFGDVVAWVNLELTKNGSEIGYARFLYASAVDVQQPVPAGTPIARTPPSA